MISNVIDRRKRDRASLGPPIEMSRPKRYKLSNKNESPTLTAWKHVLDKERKPFVLLNRNDVMQNQPDAKKPNDINKLCSDEIIDDMHESRTETNEIESDKGDCDELCEFERRRLQNLKENADFLHSLGIVEAKNNFSKFPESKRPKYKVPKEKKEDKPLSRRKSLRLQRITPEGEHLPDMPPQPPLMSEMEPERQPSGPLGMKDYVRNVVDSELHESFLSSLRCFKRKTTMTEPERFDTYSYINSLSKMCITGERVMKIVPSRIYSMALHPSPCRILVTAGDKWGRLGVWDLQSGAGEGSLFCYEPHSRPVSCLAFHPGDQMKLFSCSYDGTLRCMDMKKSVFTEIYSTPEKENIHLTSLDFLSPNSLVTSQDECVAIIDFRTNPTSAESIYPVHLRYVKCVSVHPVMKHYFVTSSADRTVCLWDLRKMSTKKPKPLQTLAHLKSVDSAYFSPITGKYILSTSLDDKIRVFDATELSTSTALKHHMSHNNHTGRWLSNFKAIWHPQREDIFVCGSMKRPRQIEMYSDRCKLLRTFQDEDYLGSVCSINALHPTRNILVGGNSSGRVHVFME